MAATNVDDRNIATAHRFYREVYEEGNLAFIDEVCAPSYVEHKPAPGTTSDRQGMKDMVGAVRKAFPDIRGTVEDVIAADNKIAVRLRLTGTFRGQWMGSAPNGKSFDVSCIDIVRFDANGQALEHWGVMDEMTFARQIGLAPQDGESS